MTTNLPYPPTATDRVVYNAGTTTTTTAGSGTLLISPNNPYGTTYPQVYPGTMITKKDVAKLWKITAEAEDRVKLLLKKYKEGTLNEDEFIQILKADKANEEVKR